MGAKREQLEAAWSAFFFTEEPPYAAVAFRIFLSLWTLAFFIPKAPHALELFARPVLREAHPIWRWLGDPVPPLLAVQLALGALMVLLLLFAFWPRPEHRTKLHIALLLPLTWLMALDTTVPRAYGGLALLQWWLLLLAPHARLRDDAGALLTPPRFGTRILMLQFCAVYFFAVFSKLIDGDGWLDGRAIFYSVRSPRFGSFGLSAWMPPDLFTSKLIGWATLLAEALIALGLWFGRTRALAALACIGLHLGIAVSMRVSFHFHALMIGHLVLFIPPRWWRRWRL